VLIFHFVVDDRTIHVWKQESTSNFTLFKVFTSDFDHLMVTYCALEPLGSKLAAVTMGGHLYVWDLGNMQYLFDKK